jgi:sugar lactone lactonase YvrE
MSQVGGFEPIASGLYLEGLAYDRSRDLIWYSDVIGGGVHGVTADGTAFRSLNAGRMWTGGVFLNSDGAILSSGAGGIMWNDPESGASGWLIDSLGGEPINGINEMISDGAGGLYFGTVDIENVAIGKTPRPSSIWRLTSRGEAIQMAEGPGFVNGMMLSNDSAQLYYNDTFDGTYAFDVRGDGSLTDRRKLLDKEDCDGMALDAEGNLWVTGYKSSALICMRPDGAAVQRIETPANAITQIRFGGADLCDVYLTSVPVDSGDNLAVGEVPVDKKSVLYRGRSGIAGQPILPTQFSLT